MNTFLASCLLLAMKLGRGLEKGENHSMRREMFQICEWLSKVAGYNRLIDFLLRDRPKFVTRGWRNWPAWPVKNYSPPPASQIMDQIIASPLKSSTGFWYHPPKKAQPKLIPPKIDIYVGVHITWIYSVYVTYVQFTLKYVTAKDGVGM